MNENDPVKLPPVYVFKTGNTLNGNFIGIDDPSGGYPYTTSHFSQAVKFNSIEKASKWYSFNKGFSSNAILCEAIITISQVPSPDIKLAKRKEALSKLTSEEIELLGIKA